MKKLFTLAALLMLTLGMNAQSKKSWDFTKGLSDETIANLIEDTGHWAENGQDADGNIIPAAEDGNYYSLDHTKTYTLFVDNEAGKEISFDNIYSDIDIEVNKTPSAVEEVNAGKTVASVNYYNLAGQMSAQPVDGVNIVVTTYTDGTRTTAKVIK